MAENSAMPLWLDIKKEYIDENFEGVLTYLHKRVKNTALQDSFYQTTVNLLDERVKSLIESVTSDPLHENMCKDEELELICRMCALYMLVFQENTDVRRNAYSLMLQSLLLLSRQYEQQLAELSIANLLGRVPGKTPFAWDDIITFNPQILAYKVANSATMSDGMPEEYWYDSKGSILLKKGELALSALSADDPTRSLLVPAIELLDGQLQILAKKNSKVKKSELDNLQAMAEFTKDFIRDLKSPVAKVRKYCKHYENGDTVDVRIIRKDNEGKIWVRTIDKEYECIEGYIKIPALQNINYYMQDFYAYLNVGDYISLQVCDVDGGVFDIGDEFKDYIINERADDSKSICAYINRITPDRSGKHKAYMWTDSGYAAQAYVNGDYKEGDYVQIKILSFGENSYYGVVMCQILCMSDDEFNVNEAKRDCVGCFCIAVEEEAEVNYLSLDMLKLLCRVLLGYQKNLPRPSDRHRILCFMRIIAEMTGSQQDAKYLSFLSDYMEALVLFAKGEYDKLRPLEFSSESEPQTVTRRKRVVEVLSAYGNDSMNDHLSDIIETDEDELIHKIAILVQSCNRIDHVISKSMQNVIKREIIKCLAIETEGDTDLEEENGVYLGIENDRQEFKTSFFHAPANAKEQNQRLTIMRGICAFLNTKVGGTLYLGVDDLGYIKGVDSDIAYMEKTAYGSYKGIDGYIRYITDEAKRHFDISMMTNIRINAMYDGKVIAITVSPFEYDIVKVEEEAFIRINSETIRMSESMRRQLMAHRILSKKEDAANVAALMDAIESKRLVVLHGYSSSSSGVIKDRIVEPFALASGQKTVWCYDLASKTNKVFKVDRISNVEIKADRWEYESHHRQAKMDIFRLTGETAIPVKLQLTLLAKNVLVEEYPEAEKDLIQTTDDDRWILETDVYQMEGIGRFYMGLAGEIQIIDAKGLKEYAQKYSKDYIL